MRRKGKQTPKPVNPQAGLQAWQRYYTGEALFSQVHGGLVRFLRWDDQGLAVVGNLVMKELPQRVALDQLRRPSMDSDAQWWREVQAKRKTC